MSTTPEMNESNMNISFVAGEDDEDEAYCTELLTDGARRSSSSETFSFIASKENNPRKNLTAQFEEHVKTQQDGPQSMPPSEKVFNSEVNVKAKQELVQPFDDKKSSIAGKIAQFEAKSATRPPLIPLKHQSNHIPTDRMAVYLRIRPLLHQRLNDQAESTIEILKPKQPSLHPTTVRTYPPPASNTTKINSHRDSGATAMSQTEHAKQYEFHQVFKPNTNQKMVYDMVATPLLEDVLDRTFALPTPRNLNTNKDQKEPLSALLFSYGITNAGKTHTILGEIKSNYSATDNEKWGIIPRTIQDIMERIHKQPKVASAIDLYMSFYEVYNEQVFDLIPKEEQKSKHMVTMIPDALKIRERRGQIFIKGLAKHKIESVQHGIDLTMAAHSRRHTSSNNLNLDSSRSHCICQLQLIPRSSSNITANQKDKTSSTANGYATDEEVVSQRHLSTIWIVDLAGSERSKRTQMGLVRQKEASQINKSLMTLMRCLAIMREKNNASAIIPFRESKLTHLFMGHLTGKSASRTAMIVNVNPAVDDFDETQHVLAYASHAKTIPLDSQTVQQKRSQFYFGKDRQQNIVEYDMTGRRKETARPTLAKSASFNSSKSATLGAAKQESKSKMGAIKSASSTGVIAKMVRGLKKLSPMKSYRHQVPDKRKKNISTTQDSMEPSHKRARAGTFDRGADAGSTTADQEELLVVKSALAKAEEQIKRLQKENEELREDLSFQESQIREEVCGEMEQRLRVARERNKQEVERLRALLQSSQQEESILASTRKAQMDDAGRKIDDLMIKVDECEEEMIRMRKEHEDEIERVLKEHQIEILNLQEQLSQFDQVKQSLKETQQQVERLKKAKTKMAENYEQALQVARASDPSGDARDSNEDNYDEENDETAPPPPLWKQKLLRATPKQRKILGTISNTTPRIG